VQAMRQGSRSQASEAWWAVGMITQPAPGTIGLTPIDGQIGKAIHVAQWLADNPFRNWFKKNTDPNYEHVVLYLGPTARYLEGAILEAEPGGSRIRSVTEYQEIYWCVNIAWHFLSALPAIVADAQDDTGIPYSFLDYLALTVRRLHLWVPGLRTYLKALGHQICSQLAVWEYAKHGAFIFGDEWTGDVMPIDIYHLEQALPLPA